MQKTLDLLLDLESSHKSFQLNGYVKSGGVVKNYTLQFPEDSYPVMHLRALQLCLQDPYTLLRETVPDFTDNGYSSREGKNTALMDADEEDVYSSSRSIGTKYEEFLIKALDNPSAAGWAAITGDTTRFEDSSAPARVKVGKHIHVELDDKEEITAIHLDIVTLDPSVHLFETFPKLPLVENIRRMVEYGSGIGRIRKFILRPGNFDDVWAI
jgi:hypothetical protein